MHFWIVQTGEPLPSDGPGARGMRASNLADALLARGHQVTIWSTDFFHQEKRHRLGRDAAIRVSERLEVRLVRSCGYRRNLGLRRFIDHAQLGFRFPRVAADVEAPDAAFVGFPPVEIAAAAVRYCNRRGIPCVLDVKDLWPDLFEDPLPSFARPLAKAILYPLHRLARTAIREAVGLCAPSEGFLDWARAKAGVGPREADIVAPLTSPHAAVSARALAEADEYWARQSVCGDGRLRAAFVGSMSRSFDLECVIRAAASLQGRRWQWVLCGDGERAHSLRTEAASLDNVVMPGWVDRAQIASLLRQSNVGLAPYRSIPNFELNICNKVYDYLHAGLPVVSPLQGDVRRLLESEHVGGTYRQGDHADMVERMDSIAVPETQSRMRVKALGLYRSRFEAAAAYDRLARHLERTVVQARQRTSRFIP